jgi:hypothetical protein
VAGVYTISATLSPTGVLANYDITYNTAAFTINKKTASVTPNTASKFYGAADPAFGGTLTGFLAADSVTATYSRTAGETVAGSPYTISAVLSPAGVLGNYDITYNTAAFTINKATSTTVVSCPASVTYNGVARTPCSATVTGAGGLNLVLTVNYSNNINAGTATASADYSGYNHLNSNDSKDFTITTAALTATVAANNKQYDGNATATINSCSLNGVMPGDQVNCVMTGYSASFDNKNAGTGKPVTATGLSKSGTHAANYTFNGTGTGLASISALDFNGFLSPIDGADATGGSFASPIRTIKLGSTLPVKFIASTNGGTPWLTGIHTIQAIKYSSSTNSDPAIDVTATDSATTGNQFRLTDGQWHFNMSTKSGFSQGTWRIEATLEDGSIHYAWIALKK